MTDRAFFWMATLIGLLWVALVTYVTEAPYEGVPPQVTPYPSGWSYAPHP